MKEMWPWITLILLGVYHGLNPGMGWLFAVALGLQERSRAAVVRAFVPIALGHAASIAVVVALIAVLQMAVSSVLLRWAGAGTLIAFGLYKLIVPMSCPRWVGMRVGFRQLTAWSFLMATACGAGLMVVPVILQLRSGSKPVVRVVPATLTQPKAEGTTTFQTTDGTQLACHAGAAGNKTTLSPVRFSSSEEQARATLRSYPAPAADTQMPACHAQIKQMAMRSGAGPLSAVAAILLHTLAMFVVMAVIAVAVYEKVGLAILRRAWLNLDLLWAGALIGAGILTFVL
ncbi:MAG TPA: hypothetical protein VFB38_01585 [Chthonomonadaceae bacterium]|nr:hypothetical protein [Chthonomonadaceae bacterium]